MSADNLILLNLEDLEVVHIVSDHWGKKYKAKSLIDALKKAMIWQGKYDPEYGIRIVGSTYRFE